MVTLLATTDTADTVAGLVLTRSTLQLVSPTGETMQPGVVEYVEFTELRQGTVMTLVRGPDAPRLRFALQSPSELLIAFTNVQSSGLEVHFTRDLQTRANSPGSTELLVLVLGVLAVVTVFVVDSMQTSAMLFGGVLGVWLLSGIGTHVNDRKTARVLAARTPEAEPALQSELFAAAETDDEPAATMDTDPTPSTVRALYEALDG